MRLHGYCEKCRNFRPVLVKVPAKMPVGICARCEEKENARCSSCRARHVDLYSRRDSREKLCRECIAQLHPETTVSEPFNERVKWPNGRIWRKA